MRGCHIILKVLIVLSHIEHLTDFSLNLIMLYSMLLQYIAIDYFMLRSRAVLAI